MTILKMSELYAPTLKEDPTEADIASHRLLLRAGMLRKIATGFYIFLPLGKRVLAKVEQIIREEMAAAGSQEVGMPILQPGELWHESGRWDDYGPEMMRLVDRHGMEYCLGPTHEEIITALVRNELRSYKQLPCSLYQMQAKYRDERRPRFGLLRSREFIMKDAYSFHANAECLKAYYERMGEAYGRVCNRLGLDWRAVEADTGEIGGSESREYMALAQAGESDLVHCTCGFASDAEVAHAHVEVAPTAARELEKIHTPGVATIAELAAFLGVEENATVKALSGMGEDGVPTVLFIPGCHELNDLKASRAIPGFEFFTDEQMVELGLTKGSMGPVGLPAGVRVVADSSLEGCPAWIVGANEHGYHYLGAQPGRDFEVDQWADLVLAKPGDGCPKCGAALSGDRGIEVSQIFQLGTKYSAAMGATFADEQGVEQPFEMGCYGIGVTRSLAAVVEQHHDEHGIVWPVSICPAEVCIIALQPKDEAVMETCEAIASQLSAAGIEVALDDRNERAGVKFNEADLMGWPYQLTVGKRGVEAGTVEFKERATGEKSEIAIQEAAAQLAGIVNSERKRYL